MPQETSQTASAVITYGHATASVAYSASVETDSDSVTVIAERNGDFWLRISERESRSAVMDRQAMQALWRTIGEALEVRGVAQ